jgi:hypothetical protein
MRSAKTLSRAIGIATVALVLAPAAARATGDTIIGFDDQAAGTLVTDTYAAQGVTFGHELSGGPQDPPIVTSAVTGSLAHSAPNVAVISHCGSDSCTNRTDGFLTNLASHVDVWVGDVGGEAFITTGIELCAYDSAGDQVGSCDTINVRGGEGVVFDLGVSSPNHDIASFSLDTFGAYASSAAHVAIDDLSFDVPSSLSIDGIGLSATAGAPFSGIVGHLADSDTTAAAADYSAKIEWGDGVTSTGTVVADPAGGFGITGTHTYAASGSFGLSVHVTKVGMTTITGTGRASVASAGPRAAFTWYPSGELCAGQKVDFDASGSTPGTAPITAYHWEFTGPAQAYNSAIVGEEVYGYPTLGNWKATDDTTTPGDTFSYHYIKLYKYDVTSYDGVALAAEAIVGSTVTLTVQDANGLTDSVTREVPFRDGYIDLHSPITFDSTPCHHSDVTAPPVFPSTTPVTLQGSAVVIPFGCTGGVLVCGGLVTLSTVAGPRGVVASAGAAAGRSASVIVGKARFALEPGRHAVIRVKLNKRGRALARHGRLHKLRVSVATVHLGPGKPKTVSRVVSVKRSRH